MLCMSLGLVVGCLGGSLWAAALVFLPCGSFVARLVGCWSGLSCGFVSLAFRARVVLFSLVWGFGFGCAVGARGVKAGFSWGLLLLRVLVLVLERAVSQE